MRHKSVSYAKYGYIFCIPFVLAFLIFSLYPIVYTAFIGFTDLKGVATTEYHVLADPLGNFKTVLSAPTFYASIRGTVIMWVCNFIPQILLALLLTAWFTNSRMKIRGQGAFKILFYMPNIITAATIAILFNALFGYPMGPVNDLFKTFGISDTPINFLLQKWTARGVVSFIQFWMWYGNTMIVLIAGVLGISPTLFEAASIDGASGVQVFFRVTLPNLRPILLYTLITSMIGGLQMFDIPRLFLLGGPDNATLTTSVYIFNQAFSGSYFYNRAAAASMLVFVVIAVLAAILFYVMRDRDAAKLKKIQKAMRKEAKAKGAATA